MKTYTLLQLNCLVRDAVETALPDTYMVQAELAEVREVRGHCYMELVEKDEDSRTPVAKASAKCWRSRWTLIKPYFERTAGSPLQAGMKVLLEVSPQFHENFGFSWIVNDIDPTFTIGDMARRRREIINRLKEEGVFDLQKTLELPAFCQRVAVISAAGAAGYGDFQRQLAENEYGLYFSTTLFPAVMQGEQTEQSVIQALNAIHAREEEFDVVVIIRGGGATSDLSGFDTLALAENVANFPLPVITGIGHDRDESVLDLIACQSVKTPTAAAAWLIDRLAQVLVWLNDIGNRLQRNVTQRLQNERLGIDRIAAALPAAARLLLARSRHRVELLEERFKSADPSLMLRRGYSITTCGGRIVRDAREVKAGDVLETRLSGGSVTSVVSDKSHL